jgi:soluble lytic murein transglycosylase-like protein
MKKNLTTFSIAAWVLAAALSVSPAQARKSKPHRKPAATSAVRKDKKAAGKKAPKKAAKSSEAETAPVDQLRDELYTDYKYNRLKGLKTAYDALEADKFSTAQKAASALVSDSRFGDYGRWVSAQADIEMGRAAIEKKSYSEAQKDAQAAFSLLSPIPTKFPYSPFNKMLSRELSLAESIMARAQCETKKWGACQANYENALERVIGTPDMSYVQTDDLSAFAKACSQQKNELCQSWMQRLAMYYSRSTEEFKAIAKSFPEYRERVPRPTSVGRITQPYRAPDLDTTAIDLAMQTYLEGKNKEAIDLFRKFTDEFPRSSSRFRANYWLAQALKKDGKNDEAKKILADLQKSSPLTYYGLLAAVENGTHPHAELDTNVPTATDLDPFLSPLELYKLRRAQNLLASKAYGLAAIELRDFRAREGLSNGFLVYLAMLHTEAKSWVSAFGILNELVARGHTAVFSQYFENLIFPLDPLPQVKKFADNQKIDPVLVLSLIKQESSFDTTASSSSGALGLMQLMPTTAVDTIPGLSRYELLTSETNLKTGTIYLSRLLSRYQGNMVYATASYNAGPGAVNRWIHSTPPGRTMLEFIESIPYKETREYVSAIIRNYFWYTQRISPESVSRLKLDFFWGGAGAPQALSPEPAAQAEESTATAANPSTAANASATPSASTTPTPSSSVMASPSASGTAPASAKPTTSPTTGPATSPTSIP